MTTDRVSGECRQSKAGLSAAARVFSVLVCFLIVGVGVVGGQTYSRPHVFTAGTPAKAAEVNANFDALLAAANDLDTRVAAIISSPWSAEVGGISYQGGRVGIGTADPGDTLHVAGGIIVGDTSQTNAGTIRWDGSNFLGYTGGAWKLLDVQAASGGGWTDFGTAVGLTAETNKVGIGTASPSEKLTVTGVVYSTTGGFRFPDGTTQTSAADATATGDGHSLNSPNGTFVDALHVTDWGRVGIGVSDVTHELTVAGNIKTGNGYYFPDDTYQVTAAFGDGHSLNSPNGTFVDALHVNDWGRVGIGVSDVTHELTVAGNIKTGNGYYFPDDTYQVTAAFGDGHSLNSPNGAFVDALFVSDWGRVGIGTTDPQREFFVNGGAGGTTGWYNDSHSSFKEQFRNVDVLEKVKRLRIQEWQYRPEHTTADNYRHISPFAEDFHDLLGLGGDKKQIQALDVAGVALKAIQEQQRLIEELQGKIDELMRRIERMEGR